MGNQSELVFDALGDPVRRRIVELLRDRPRPVGELALALPVGRPAVSKHLKVLSGAGITHHRSHGTSNVYSLRPEAIEAARDWLGETWDAVLGAYVLAAREESARSRAGAANVKERAK